MQQLDDDPPTLLRKGQLIIGAEMLKCRRMQARLTRMDGAMAHPTIGRRRQFLRLTGDLGNFGAFKGREMMK